MRLIELTLLIGLLAAWSPSYGQDVVKNEKSIAPVPDKTPAKTAAAPANATPKMDLLLPRNMELIIGKAEAKSGSNFSFCVFDA